MGISIIFLIYLIILTIILRRSYRNLMLNAQTNYRTIQRCSTVIFYTIFIFSLILFEILLVIKLDKVMKSTDIMDNIHYLLDHQKYMKPMPVQILNSNNINININTNENDNKDIFIKNNGNIYSHYSIQREIVPIHYNNIPFQRLNQPEISDNNNNIKNNTSHNSFNHIYDYASFLSYFVVSLPLQLAYFSLMCLSFNSHSGNYWWFAMRRDFCDIFLKFFKVFRTYGNIKVKLTDDLNEQNQYRHRNRSRRQQQQTITTMTTSTQVTNQMQPSLITEQPQSRIVNEIEDEDQEETDNELLKEQLNQVPTLTNNESSTATSLIGLTSINTSNCGSSNNYNNCDNEGESISLFISAKEPKSSCER
jgi:hypothetical protein